MTFCCRPSPNCLRCRQRRIKCDRAKPACSQCKRANKECSGYRDEVSVLFRNENDRIIRRSKAAQERSLAKDQAVCRSPGQASDARSNDKKLSWRIRETIVVSDGPKPMVALDIDAQGLQFFFHHFSTAPWGLPQGEGHNSLFHNLDMDTSFRDSIVSVGLAALSNVRRDRGLLSLARQRYGASLRAVRGFVEDPACANIDSLVKMILMLAIFEMVDAKPDALSSWAVHITGVSSLLKRYAFPLGLDFNPYRELWFYIAATMKYFQVGGPFPIELDSWALRRMDLLTHDTRPAFELVEILIEFVRLCIDIPHLERVAAQEEILHRAVGLEAQFQDWQSGLPTLWSFAVEETEDIQGTFYGQYHVYNDAWASRVLIHYYHGRLLVHEVILATVSQLEDPAQEWITQRERSLAVVNQMATDTCVGIATQCLFDQPVVLPNGGIGRPPLKGVFMMIYPLTIAASATGVSQQLRDWSIRTLQMIGDRLGVRQALEAIPRIHLAVASGVQVGAFFSGRNSGQYIGHVQWSSPGH
ncbi:hypothetical protein BJY04DRAFT_189721 [Aspergillus karnatakaensis]|uniref:Zn(II)2Cys6 transcription factor domain-containing protein n=1 Tax=Aspergillus karnatakaensis TaxID=1810916 RepID=UPI003CCDDE57